VNDIPLLATPPTVTSTFPEVAPVGTAAMIDVEVQLAMVVAVVPLNATVLAPCVAPKSVPVIVTDSPTAPDVGERLVIFGWANDARSDTTQKTTRATSCHFLFMVWSLLSLRYDL
jgi:hypothetical protein